MREKKAKYCLEFTDGMDGKVITYTNRNGDTYPHSYWCEDDAGLERTLTSIALECKWRLRPYRRGIIKNPAVSIVDFGDYRVFARVTNLKKKTESVTE